MTDDVPHIRRKTDKWVIACTLLALLCALVVAIGGSTVLKNRNDLIDVEGAARGNFQAIVASCEILNRKIVESQRQMVDPDSSTAILIKIIVSGAPPKLRQEWQRRVAQERRSPKLRLKTVNCRSAARKARQRGERAG